jgi:hypothetical protein
VFPVRNELNSYMLFGRNSVFKGLSIVCFHYRFIVYIFMCVCKYVTTKVSETRSEKLYIIQVARMEVNIP